MIQIGNEITNGFLWDSGRVGGPWDTDAQWSQFVNLLRAGVEGAQAGAGAHPPEVMLHIDRGGDNAGSRKFWDRIVDAGIPFDVMGLSYYPWWHGTLSALKGNLEDLAMRYRKDLIVVETAYPWTLSTGPNGHAMAPHDLAVHPGYPATVDGQAAFLRDLMHVVRSVPEDHGRGLYYWEPCWIPSQAAWSVGHPNNWANLALFDFSGGPLASLRAWNQVFN
jgi:arabinogalactan endo-1,4-beta-galactosidase